MLFCSEFPILLHYFLPLSVEVKLTQKREWLFTLYMWESIKLCRKAGSFSRKGPENTGLGVTPLGETLGAATMYKDKCRQVATLRDDQRKSWGS